MNESILIVDDNADSVRIMHTILDRNGYRAVAVMSGSEALDLLEKEKPDLILLDVMMPKMSGIEVLQQIKGNPATGNIPVIMVTAKTRDDDVLSGYQYGADYYITKPFTAKQLLYGINLVLGRGGSVA